MDRTTLNYKLIKKVKNSKFNIEHLHDYNLLIQIGEDDLQLFVSDTQNNQGLLVEDYVMDDINSSDDLIQTISKIFEEHNIITAGFWNAVRVSVKSQKFTLVPEKLFDKNALEDYLKITNDVDLSRESLFYNKTINADAIVVFAVDKKIADWINNLYPTLSIQFIHQTTELIEGFLSYKGHSHLEGVFLFVDRGFLNIMVTKNKKLHFFNRFYVPDSGKFIKYILLVYKELGLDPNATKAMAWGFIDPNSPQFQEMYKYILNVSFGKKPTHLRFDYTFDEIKDHHYFDLYGSNLCE